jgi:ribosome-binding protein aMBF1 (putative translation factor)
VNKTLGSEQHEALIAFLIKRRKAAGLSQEELAAKLGEYQSFVARMESGQRRVDLVEFLTLATILKFDAKAALAEIAKVR